MLNQVVSKTLTRPVASTAPDVRTFEQVLKSRLAEVGVYGRHSAGCDCRLYP